MATHSRPKRLYLQEEPFLDDAAGGVQQREMGERLGEVAEMATGGVSNFSAYTSSTAIPAP